MGAFRRLATGAAGAPPKALSIALSLSLGLGSLGLGSLGLGSAAGCGLSDPHPTLDAGLPTDAPMVPRRLLTVEGATSLTLAPLAETTLRFRVADEAGGPVEGAVVSFALDGLPRSSTLRQVSGTTDAAGIVWVALVAGPEATTFRLRATTSSAAPAVVDVSVGTEFGELAVTIEPEFTRNVHSYLVRAVADVPCADVPSSPTGDERTLGTELASTTFPALSTAASWTLEARGQTAAGTTVARGCVEGIRVAATAPASTRVVVRDLPLDTSGAFSLTWTLEASPLGARARTETFTAAVGESGAEVLLDGLRDSLAATSVTDLDALDRARAAALDSRLAEELRASRTTLGETLGPFADQIDAGFAALALESTLRPTSLPAFSPFAVRVVTYDVGMALEPLGASVSVATGGDALVVSGLELPMSPRAVWVAAFVTRVGASSSEGLTGVLRDGASCGTLASFLAREAVLAACDARCARGGGEQAAVHLEARLHELAAAPAGATPPLRPDTTLDTHDDDDDLRADRIDGYATVTWEEADGSAPTSLDSRWSALRDDTLE